MLTANYGGRNRDLTMMRQVERRLGLNGGEPEDFDL